MRMTPISVRSATTSLLAFSVLSQTVTGFLAVGPSTSRGTNNVAKKRPLTLTLKSSMANECPDFTGYHAPSVTPHSTTTAAGSSSSHPEEATTTSLSAVEATAAVLEDYYYVPDTAEQQPVFDLSESILAPSASSPATTNGFSLDHPSLSFARILVLAASAVYGTNFAMVKLLDEQMPLAISAAMRFSLAAVVTAFVILQGEDNNDENKADGALVGKERTLATWAGAEIGSWYCAGYLCQAMGLQTADASKSAFFNALAVIVVPLLDAAFRGKQLGPKGISSIALAILGVGLLQLGPSLLAGNGNALTTINAGDWFCLGQAFLFGIGYWRLEHKSSQFPHQAGRITVGMLGGVAAGSTAYAAVSQHGSLPSLQTLQGWLGDPFTVGALGWTALISTALALYLETVALKAMSATELTILMTSVSLFGSGFAYLTMGETMSPIGMVGGLMILAGCVFSSLGGSGSGTTVAQQPPALSMMETEEDDDSTTAGNYWETNTLLEEDMAYSTRAAVATATSEI